MSNRKKKVLFGAVDVGWRIELYTKFIKKNLSDKLEPHSVVYYKLQNKQYETSYDYEYSLINKNIFVNWIIRLYFFTQALFKYDIFYFISGETLLTRNLRRFELIIYKLLKKKIYFHFVGSDIRDPEYIDWKSENIISFLEGNDKKEKSKKWQMKLILDAEKFANNIFVSTPDLLSVVNNAEYIPVFIDIDKFNSDLEKVYTVNKKKDIIYILHAPSNRRLKGSKYIEETLKKIKKENNFNIELLLPQNNGESTYSTSRYKLFEYYKKADIVIDQMIIGWYGLQAIEALLTENIVISYIDTNLKKHLFDDCPIMIADVTNLEKFIAESIKQVKQKKWDFETQKKWVRKYHTIDSNKEFINKLP